MKLFSSLSTVTLLVALSVVPMFVYILNIQRMFKQLNHSGNVSSSSVNGDIAFLWEWSNFDHA